MKKRKIVPYILVSSLVLSSLSGSLTVFAEEALTGNEINATIDSRDSENQEVESFVEAETFATSGTWGTCPWTIDSKGVLTIKSGTLGRGQSGSTPTAPGLNRQDVTKVIIEENVKTGTSAAELFMNWGKLTEIENLINLDTSNTRDMSRMFSGCQKLTTIDVSGFNTSKVTNMDSMFSSLTSVNSLDLSNFDMSNVTNTNTMLYTALESLTLGETCQFPNDTNLASIKTTSGIYTGGWTQENGTKVFPSSSAFIADYNGATDAGTYVWEKVKPAPVIVKYIDEQGKELAESDTLSGGLGDAYITKAKDIKGYELKETPINATGSYTSKEQTVNYVYEKSVAKWGTCPWILEDGVLTIEAGILGKGTATNIVADIPKNEVTKVVFEGSIEAQSDSTNLFSSFPNLQSFENMKNFDTSNVTMMQGMFENCTSLKTIDVSNFNTSKVITMNSMFSGTGLTNLDMSQLDMGEIQYKGSMFSGSNNLSTLTLSDKNQIDGTSLPAINTDSGKYTGAWISTDEKKIFPSSSDFMSTYNGKTDAGTYIWEVAKVAPVTVNYVDGKGGTLAEPDTLIGEMGDVYTTKAKAIKGYELKETPENATGTFSKEAQTVTYVYEAIEGGEVTVNYEDTEGNKLAESDVLTGKFGTSFESNAVEITGYELKETPENATGTFSETAQTVTYVYQAVQGGDITVNYVDTAGKVLDTQTVTGKFNESYTTEAKMIEGYTLKTTPKNHTGLFTLEAQTVTYVYQASVGAPVTVRYINQVGNEIAASTSLTGKVGQTVTATAKTPGGYTLTSASNTQEATIGTTEQTITFEYQGNAASKVTTEYVDTEGVRIAPVQTITGGNIGDAYATEAETIQGYTLQTTPENASGFRTQGAITVTYVYKKKDSKPFMVNYVGVQQQQVVGFVPEGITTTKVSLLIKKDGSNEWVDTGYTGTPDADTGYFAIESRFVKGTKDFLLNNKDQIKVVFTDGTGENYEGVQVVQPYTAPVVNDFTEGDDYLTGSVPNGANQVRVSINGNRLRVVNSGPIITDDAGINAVTGEFSIWAKTWCEGSYGSSPMHQTKAGDVITVDYGAQIYGAFNNPSTTIVVK